MQYKSSHCRPKIPPNDLMLEEKTSRNKESTEEQKVERIALSIDANNYQMPIVIIITNLN
jgi:hypothetical protein